MKETIEHKEEELRLAMISSDVDALDDLIDDSLIFTLPTGDIATKSMDLDAHSSGVQKITELKCLAQKIVLHDTFAVVASKMELKGNFLESSIDGIYSYSRTWKKIGSSWKVVAGQVSIQM